MKGLWVPIKARKDPSLSQKLSQLESLRSATRDHLKGEGLGGQVP